MSRLGFAARLLYFLVAPFTVLAVSAVIPMTGVLVNFVVLIASFMAIELLRGSADRYRIVRVIARRQLWFGEYYQRNPPRMFLYYVLYPLLLPYVLVNRRARQELGLYRGFTALGVVLLVVFGAIDYASNWAPEIAPGPFFSAFFATFVMQVLTLMALMIPLAVTIVGFQLAGRSRAVWTMLATAGVSILLTFAGRHGSRVVEVPVDVQMRVRVRAEAVPERAEEVEVVALRGVWSDVRGKRAEIAADGWVGGESLGRARGALAGLFRGDEAAAFSVVAWPADAPTHVLVQCHQPGSRPPVWLAMAADGTLVRDPAVVPAGVLGSKPHVER